MENLVSLYQFYKGKKVFLTGHTGFKGAWLAAWLYQLGAEIKGYSLEPEYENGLFDLLLPLKIFENKIGDIRNRVGLKSEIQSFQPDLIFHLAAQPLVRRSYHLPAETFDVNVTGTANVLEAVAGLQKKTSVVVITTDKVYENIEKDVLYNESNSLGGYDPYSASKACAELVVSSFRNSFFPPLKYSAHNKSIASARAGNVIGGGDWSADRIIPDIIRALEQEKQIRVRNPYAIRAWQHLLEPLSCYLIFGKLLFESPAEFSRAYNFGPLPEDHLTVQELVEEAISSWGNGNWKDESDPSQPHEAGILKLDISLAQSSLKWKPKLKAREAIDWTIQWYKHDKNSLADFTFRQIKTFEEL